MRASLDVGLESGVHTATLQREGLTELFITTSGDDGSDLDTQFARVARVVQVYGARIVSQQVFHAGAERNRVLERLKDPLTDIAWPITWVENGTSRRRLTGLFVHAVQGTVPQSIVLDGHVVGTVYEDAWARHVSLGGLIGHRTGEPAGEQARRVFADMDEALARGGMDFACTIRTWFYNRDILAWYKDFNSVRTAFFQGHRVFDGLVPASTGIGATNPFGSALNAALIAVKPKNREVCAMAVPSPLQCPALAYGSSFSRAVEVKWPDHRRLYISGTASIDADGKTVFQGDVKAQVAQTMKVVKALLESRGMDWTDAVRGIAYFRNADDAPLFQHYCLDAGLPPLPVIVTNNVICRDDLLFEIEIDAVAVL